MKRRSKKPRPTLEELARKLRKTERSLRQHEKALSLEVDVKNQLHTKLTARTAERDAARKEAADVKGRIKAYRRIYGEQIAKISEANSINDRLRIRIRTTRDSNIALTRQRDSLRSQLDAMTQQRDELLKVNDRYQRDGTLCNGETANSWHDQWWRLKQELDAKNQKIARVVEMLAMGGHSVLDACNFFNIREQGDARKAFDKAVLSLAREALDSSVGEAKDCNWCDGSGAQYDNDGSSPCPKCYGKPHPAHEIRPATKDEAWKWVHDAVRDYTAPGYLIGFPLPFTPAAGKAVAK